MFGFYKKYFHIMEFIFWLISLYFVCSKAAAVMFFKWIHHSDIFDINEELYFEH